MPMRLAVIETSQWFDAMLCDLHRSFKLPGLTRVVMLAIRQVGADDIFVATVPVQMNPGMLL